MTVMPRKHRFFLIAMAVLVMALVASACAGSDSKTTTIGIVHLGRTTDVVDGFKSGMAELGYIDGETLSYIYEGPVSSMDDIDQAIQNLMSGNVDLIFTATTPATLRVKRAVQGTDTPVVFAQVYDPVRSGVVESLIHPGGNVTGVRGGGHIPKMLEWLLAVAPSTEQVFVPHNPDDNASVMSLQDLTQAAMTLGVELVIAEVRTSAELDSALGDIPQDVDALFVLSSGFLGRNMDVLTETARRHTLPIAGGAESHRLGALLSFGLDTSQAGKQASRLAYAILEGAQPAELPVETADFYLSFNLRTAQAINIDIPGDILAQADDIIR